jgi:hypothetical protein
VIVRVVSKGQYRLHDDALRRLNELDNAVVEAVDAGDEERFRVALGSMLAFVEQEGEHLGDAELVTSDHILPPPDSTMDEVREDFAGEGLIPG